MFVYLGKYLTIRFVFQNIYFSQFESFLDVFFKHREANYRYDSGGLIPREKMKLKGKIQYFYPRHRSRDTRFSKFLGHARNSSILTTGTFLLSIQVTIVSFRSRKSIIERCFVYTRTCPK